MNIETKPFNFSKTIIKEGKFNLKELKALNKDKCWVESKLKSVYQTNVQNVLFATLDNEDNLKVFLYK